MAILARVSGYGSEKSWFDRLATYAEKTDFRETPRYAETVEYCRRFAAESPLIRFSSFGKSGEGRDLPLLIVSNGEAFDPKSARKQNRAVVLIQACIHAGGNGW